MRRKLIKSTLATVLIALWFALMQSALWARNFTTENHVDLNQQPSPLETCTEAELAAAFTALEDYQPTEGSGFVTLADDAFLIDGEPFLLRGINYYPSNYPWRRFLTETDPDTLRTELALMQDAGLNSLRIFMWNEALFQCPGSGAVPIPENIARLDMIIREAAAHDFYLIVTLNDLPDLTDHILYLNPEHIQQQTEFLVTRYREEPAILAWDLRNEGDIDYDGINVMDPGAFERDLVLDWLSETSEQVRALDDNHLITAGWRFNEQHTEPYVDFVSFHHWRDAESLATRLSNMNLSKPVLLQEFGYTTFDRTPDEQAQLIEDVIALSEEGGLLGWMIWTAFDFPLTATCYPGECISADNREHHFGIWTSDYLPKPAVEVLR